MPELVAAAIAEEAVGATAITASEIAASEAAATAAAEAAAQQAAAQTAAQQAGQAGIMQSAAVPPPGTTPPPGASGFGAPAQPLEAAGASAQPLPPTGEPINPTVDGTGFKTTPDKMFGPNSSGIYNGVDPATNMPYQTISSPTFEPPTSDGTGFKVSDALQKSFGQPPEKNALQKGFETGLKYVGQNPMTTGMGLMAAGQYMNQPETPKKKEYKSSVNMSNFKPTEPVQQPFQRSYDWQGYAVGGPVEQMSAINSTSGNTMYPQAGLQTAMYSNPMMQRPVAENVVNQGVDTNVDSYTGEQKFSEGGVSEDEYDKPLTRSQKGARGLNQAYAEEEKRRMQQLATVKGMGDKFDEGIIPRSRTQQMTSPYSAAQSEFARLAKKSKVPVAQMPKTNLGDIDTYMDTPIDAANGGIMHGLGGYSDGGRLLKGPGDGVSDSIPAVIGAKQPARLADGEFVVPARIVSELGNGSTEAGARKLYAMMERVQASRKKSIGKKKVAVNSKADKHLPA